MCDGRDLPWLQDTTTVDAWGLWDVEYRDVVILDADGVRHYSYNLTVYDLADSDHRDLLKELIREVAASP